MKDLPSSFPPQFLTVARVTRNTSERAWQYPVVQGVIAALAEAGYAVLGGDVMQDDEGELSYYSLFDGVYRYNGNWSCSRRSAKQSWAEYVTESAAAAVRYIEGYVGRNGDSFRYLLVFVNEVEYLRLPQ